MNPTTRNIEPTVHLWAAFGGPSELPGRLEVVICPVCAALVAAGGGEALHAAGHARRDAQ